MQARIFFNFRMNAKANKLLKSLPDFRRALIQGCLFEIGCGDP